MRMGERAGVLVRVPGAVLMLPATLKNDSEGDDEAKE